MTSQSFRLYLSEEDLRYHCQFFFLTTMKTVLTFFTLLLVSSSAFAPCKWPGIQRGCQRPNYSNSATKTSATKTSARRHFDDDSADQSTNPLQSMEHVLKSTFLAFSISLATLTSPVPAIAADSGAIVSCLFSQCQLPLAKCILNPKCLANVACINTCNGREDEIGCQIKCGDLFENEVVGEFNKCAVSDMGCVPQQQDEGLYPIPAESDLVPKFDTKLWNGKWYITAGQNPLFDIFPCQVHFFTETAPGTFFGKLNWRIEEPDGEFFNRDAIQQFVQDPKQPAHLVNHDNEYLHYKDDWYIVDFEYDDNKDGVPPFAFVYYRGSNDAWDGYGGVVVYTRDAALPESLLPRLRVAAEKIGYDFDKDFTITDNSCPTEDSAKDALIKREKFAGKVILQGEEQLQATATRLRGTAANSVKAQKLFFNEEAQQAEKAYETLRDNLVNFEKEILER